MWPDPTNPPNKKPKYLKETPAHKFFRILSGVGTILLFSASYSIWYIPYFKRKSEKVVEENKLKKEKIKATAYLDDPIMQRVLQRKTSEYEQEISLD